MNKQRFYTHILCALMAFIWGGNAAFAQDTSEAETVYEFGTTGTVTGTTTSYDKKISVSYADIKFTTTYKEGSTSFLTIKPKQGKFGANDVLTLSGYAGETSTKTNLALYEKASASATALHNFNSFSKDDDTPSTFTYTLDTECDSIVIARTGGSTIHITSLKVVRPASSDEELTASFEEHSTSFVVGTQTKVVLPPLTVTKKGISTTDYTVKYTSDNTELANINSDNDVELKTGVTGSATITAEVTVGTTDNTKETTTATYQINVLEKYPFNISVTDVNMNVTDATYDQPEIKVYANNEEVESSRYSLTVTASEENPNVTYKDGTFTVAGSARNWTAGTTTFTITATPTDAEKEENSSYKAASTTFTFSVNSGKVKPAFLSAFQTSTINIKASTNEKSNSSTTTVPLIYGGEDISEHFTYTYEIKKNESSDESTTTTSGGSVTTSGIYVTYTAGTTNGTDVITVSATPKDDYADLYDAPEPMDFKVNVSSDYVIGSAVVDPETYTMNVGDAESLPEVTVKDAAGDEIASADYTKQWISFSPGVANVDGVINAKSLGTAAIHLVISGDKLQTITKTITVNVESSSVYAVNANTAHTKQTVLTTPDGNLSATLGGWLFNDVTPSSDVTTVKLNDGDWGSVENQSGDITGFTHRIGEGTNNNARQEDGSNAQPESTDVNKKPGSSDKGIVEVAATTVDKMFNVPAAGSFVAFTAKTNGKVTAHIAQNGSWDYTNDNKNVYRAQRRVFVVDEAGNFVPSTATIARTTDKPRGGSSNNMGESNLSKWTWDLPYGKTSLTLDSVKTHYKNLPESFSFDYDSFQNGVYESNLIDRLDNKVAQDQSLSGAGGWVVLADAPVTYTFNAKAGKTYHLYCYGSRIGLYGFSFSPAASVKVDEVSYNDNSDDTNVEATEEGHVAKVTIPRDFTKGVWSSCVLPFSLNKQQVDAIFGETYSSTNTSGTQILYYDHIGTDPETGKKVIYFVRHAYNTIVAGKPFLIKPTKDVDDIITSQVEAFPYVTIENTQPADWCTGDGFAWVSSYNKGKVENGDYYVGSGSGNIIRRTAGEVDINGFRGYLKAQTAEAKAKELSTAFSSNTGDDDNGTTAIYGIVMDTDGTAQAMPKDGKVYGLNGQCVASDRSKLNTLPSGIYIINGVKIVK